MDSHEEFLELCAASTAGELTACEETRLEEHLAHCASCRRAKQEFETAIQRAVPSLAGELDSYSEASDPGWSVRDAEASFFTRLERDKNSAEAGDPEAASAGPELVGRRFTYRPSRIPWAELWMPVAACALLAIALGIVAYRIGIKRGLDTAQKQTVEAPSTNGTLEAQISDLGHERNLLGAKLSNDDEAIKDLNRQLAAQTLEISELKATNSSPVVRTSSEEHNGSLSWENARRAEELEAAQNNLRQLQVKFDALNQQRDDAARNALSLQAKVEELTKLAHDRDQALEEQQAEIAKQHDLLDHDRDIRELMGARDLYIAEVHDVGGNGETDKTYGRVFYTKGKSLIFYAYDLDQEAGVKNASTFQAWGRRGVDKQEALNLGMFYEDNASKKRWVLKLDDPKTLANIDAVFVTAEPNGGSHHPSGKQLLFAYLRVTPNHP